MLARLHPHPLLMLCVFCYATFEQKTSWKAINVEHVKLFMFSARRSREKEFSHKRELSRCHSLIKSSNRAQSHSITLFSRRLLYVQEKKRQQKGIFNLRIFLHWTMAKKKKLKFLICHVDKIEATGKPPWKLTHCFVSFFSLSFSTTWETNSVPISHRRAEIELIKTRRQCRHSCNTQNSCIPRCSNQISSHREKGNRSHNTQSSSQSSKSKQKVGPQQDSCHSVCGRSVVRR